MPLLRLTIVFSRECSPTFSAMRVIQYGSFFQQSPFDNWNPWDSMSTNGPAAHNKWSSSWSPKGFHGRQTDHSQGSAKLFAQAAPDAWLRPVWTTYSYSLAKPHPGCSCFQRCRRRWTQSWHSLPKCPRYALHWWRASETIKNGSTCPTFLDRNTVKCVPSNCLWERQWNNPSQV